jgi:shikimate kinase
MNISRSVTGPQSKRCICLIGFMGAGKTSVGRILAQRLGWNFFDLDELIESREQRSVAGIFDELGESVFREIESSALMDLLQRSEESCVLALGGGAFVQPQNRQALERAGATTILLSAPIEELERRCAAADGSRPLFRSRTQFEQLFAARRQVYALAGFRVETLGKEISEVAGEIERCLAIEESEKS